MPFIERARGWPLETLPVPADLLVYTACEWQALRARGGRFARVLMAETVWLLGRRAGSRRTGRPAVRSGLPRPVFRLPEGLGG